MEINYNRILYNCLTNLVYPIVVLTNIEIKIKNDSVLF